MFIKNSRIIFNFFSRKNPRKTLLAIIVLLILFLSLFPRSIDFLNGNPVFGFDQGREYLAAQNIVVNHKPILIGTEIGAGVAGISGIFQGPVYYYLLTIPFILFSGNPVGGVLLMLLFGLASIYFGFFFGKKLFGLIGGILIALLFPISPILISQSRFIWSPNPPTLFILLSFFFFYLFIKDRKNLYIFLASFFAGFIYNFEIAISVPLSLSIILYSPFLIRKKIKGYFYLILGLLVAYLPMIAFETRHGFLGIKGIFSYLFSNKGAPSSAYFRFIPDHFNAFLNNFHNTFTVNNPDVSYVFMAVVLAGSIYFLIREKNKTFKIFFIFLLIIIPVNFFVFSFLRNAVYDYYLTDLSICYIFLFSYLIYSLFNRKFYPLGILSMFFVTLLVLIGLISSIKTSAFDYSDYGATAKLKGKLDAIDYIYRDSKGKRFNLLVFSPPVYTYPYDYLLDWYGKRKYGFIPGKERQGVVYLLIEKDPSQPWTYRGWLKTVIKKGKIIKTVTLPSGFIVQEREM